MKSINTHKYVANQHRQDLWHHFGRLNSFVSGYDFNEDGGWVPGHDQYITYKTYWVNNHLFFHKPEYEGVVETFYLRSPDEEHAIGIVANNTYNFYTQWTCSQEPFDGDDKAQKIFECTDDNYDANDNDITADKPWVLVNDDMYSNKRTISYDDEKIYIKGLSGNAGLFGKRYNIDFISPFTLNVVSTVIDRKGSNGVQIKYPDIRGVQETSMYLIRVYPYNKNKSFDTIFNQNVYIEQFNQIYDNTIQRNETGIKIYPNPANDKLNVEIPDVSALASIIIYDLSGRTVFNLETYNVITEIEVSHFNPGTYILKVIASNCTKNFKFVKQ